MSELLWIAVPGGFDERDGARGALLRVVIMPKVEGDSLAAAGMDRWPPPALATSTLAIDFARSADADVQTVDVAPPHVRAQDGLWEQFFGPSTTVNGRRAPASTGAVNVDRTSRHASKVKTTFETCARARVDESSSSALSEAARRQLEEHWRDTESGGAPPTPPPTGPRNEEPPDFHRTLALLREHPAVLRALGLIVDIALPLSAVPTAFAEGVVRVRWPDASSPSPSSSFPEIVSPWTRYGREFLPLSTDNISAGMVTLTDDRVEPGDADIRWDVVTVDVNGAGARLREAARALPQTAAGGGAAPSDAQPVMLPALRTAGLMLVCRDRASDFDTRRRVSRANAARGTMREAVLTADDLVLGYRLDVSTIGGEWLSLHERVATYRLGEDLIIGARDADEEGHVKAHAATSDASGALHADEVVARWSGWSLAVPQPTFDRATGRPRPTRRSSLPFDFRWQFEVKPDSLPALRFARQYRMRARVADLAGGGLRLDAAAADRCATGFVPYRRYEPVSSPDVRLPEDVAADALGPAESIVSVVIRSDGGTVAEFATLNPRYALRPRRAISPPRASLMLAEQHGVLDGLDDERAFEVVTRASQADAIVPDPAAGGVCAFPRAERGGILAARADSKWPATWPDLPVKHIELRERGSSTAAAVAWERQPALGDVLVVRLAKAEQVTLELSSFLQDDFLDHFAIKDPLPNESEAIAQQGRHPMVTPATPVTLVHAVRRPLNDPAGTLTPKRAAGETFAQLDAAPALLGVDTKSTGQVQITASWTERRDDQRENLTAVPVQSIVVDRGDRALKDVIRHQFGDTRHRAITYSVAAVSRFRRFFDEDDDEHDEAFIARTTLTGVVMVPSSARPAPPVVIATRPSFPWREEREQRGDTTIIRRRRLGGHVRVELERPWYQTGEGERLAVIVSSDGRPADALWPYLAQAGRDPIWDTTAPPRWPTADMLTATADARATAFLENVGQSVDLVTHEAWFHGDRWYADIALPRVAAASYCPLVQLGVARYQAHSIVDAAHVPPIDLRLSRAVKTEIVPLLPERTLTITRTGRRITVLLDGLGPQGPRQNRVDVVLEHLPAATGSPASTIDAIDLTAFDEAASGPLAWRAVAGAVRHGSLGVDVTIDLPSDLGPLRVRVREVECVGVPEPPPPQTGTAGEFSERVVFTDTVVL